MTHLKISKIAAVLAFSATAAIADPAGPAAGLAPSVEPAAGLAPAPVAPAAGLEPAVSPAAPSTPEEYLDLIVLKKQEAKRLRDLIPAYDVSSQQLAMKQQIAQDSVDNLTNWLTHRSRELETAKLSTAAAASQLEADKKSLTQAQQSLAAAASEAQRAQYAATVQSFTDAIAAGEQKLAAKQADEAYLTKLVAETKADLNAAVKQATIYEQMADEYGDFALTSEAQKIQLERELAELNREIEELSERLAALTTAQNPEKAAEIMQQKQRLDEIIKANKTDGLERVEQLLLLKERLGSKSEIERKEARAQIAAIGAQIADEELGEHMDEISTTAAAALGLQLNNMNKRLGELRGLGGEAGFWLRGYGGRMSYLKSNFDYYATQLGFDDVTETASGKMVLGAMFGYDETNASVASKSFSAGFYASRIYDSGAFADFTAKYLLTKYSSDEPKEKFRKQQGVLLSIEGGYRFELPRAFYAEPSLELIGGYVGKYEKSTASGQKVSMKAHAPLIFKPQIFAGYDIGEFALRAGVGGIFDAGKKRAEYQIGDVIAGIGAESSAPLKRDSRGFASLGAAAKLGDASRLNIALERGFGGSRLKNDYEINATLRVEF